VGPLLLEHRVIYSHHHEGVRNGKQGTEEQRKDQERTKVFSQGEASSEARKEV
jgi:hypothetical protein